MPVRLPASLRSRAYSSASGQVLRATWGAWQYQAVRSAWCVFLVHQVLDVVSDLAQEVLDDVDGLLSVSVLQLIVIFTVIGALLAAIWQRIVSNVRECSACHGFGIARCGLFICRPGLPPLTTVPDDPVLQQVRAVQGHGQRGVGGKIPTQRALSGVPGPALHGVSALRRQISPAALFTRAA